MQCALSVPSRYAEYYITSKRTHSLDTSTEMPAITRKHWGVVEELLAFSHGGAFARMSRTEQDDLQIVKLALDYDYSFFQYASEDTRQNRDLILGSLPGCSSLMFYVPDNLKQDPVFMLKAIAANFRVLHYADWLIQNNSTFLYKAVRVHEQAIWMLPEHVRNTIACETKLAAALYLLANLPLELCFMVFQMQ